MGGWRWLALLALLAGACAQAQPPVPAPVRAAGPTQTVAIDTQRSLLGFEIRTRYGQRLTGRFPVFSGQVQTLADGRHQVSLVIDARSAEVSGPRRYTAWLRGAEFFDVQHHPQILSQPHPADTALAGGDVEGELTLRGIRGPIRMRVMPAQCDAPGYDCPVSGRGTVSRTVYGMDGWQLALGDRVTFVMQVRLSGVDPS